VLPKDCDDKSIIGGNNFDEFRLYGQHYMQSNRNLNSAELNNYIAFLHNNTSNTFIELSVRTNLGHIDLHQMRNS